MAASRPAWSAAVDLLQGGVDGVAELVVAVDDQQGQQLVAARDVAVDRGRDQRRGRARPRAATGRPLPRWRGGRGRSGRCRASSARVPGPWEWWCPCTPCVPQLRAPVTEESTALAFPATLVHDGRNESTALSIRGELMNTVHVVTGAGPVGSTVALQLADAGHQVRLLTRSGSGPVHPLDRAPPRRRLPPRGARRGLRRRGRGAPLHPRVGVRRQGLARRAPAGRGGGARGRRARRRRRGLPGEPLLLRPGRRPDDRGRLPRTATTGKLGVRTELLAQRDGVGHADGQRRRVRLLRSRSSAPPTRASGWCRPCWPGGPCGVIGSLDQPHSFTYVPDLAAAMITAAARPELWNSFLHAPTAPPVTQRRARRAGRGGRRRAGPARCRRSRCRCCAAMGLVLARDARAGRDRLHVRPALRPRLVRQRAAPRARADAARGRHRRDRRVVAAAGAARRPDRRTDE